jgi:glycosyltransferase involved in cell wall biosynthesis
MIDAINALPEAEVTLVIGNMTAGDRLRAQVSGQPAILHLPTLVREPRLRSDIATLRALRKTVRDLSPDVVHTHQAKAGILGRLAARGSGAAVVHSSSMATFGEGYPRVSSAVYRAIERLTHRFVDRFALVGHDLGARLVAAGLPAGKMTVVRSALALEPFFAVRRSSSISSDPLTVLYVGSLEPRKGVDRLVAFCTELSRHMGRDVRLRIAGEGELGVELNRQAGALPHGISMELLGYRADVPALMSESDLAVLLSSCEGMPQFLVQAAAAGVPFSAFDVDGTRELVGMGASASIAPLGSVNALAQLAAAMLREAGSMISRDSFGQWDEKQVWATYRRIYREVLHPAPERQRRGRRTETV